MLNAYKILYVLMLHSVAKMVSKLDPFSKGPNRVNVSLPSPEDASFRILFNSLFITCNIRRCRYSLA
jgi:hypothetical protein